MATEKRRIHRVVDADGTLIQVLPETSAEQVTLADAGDKFTSTNVEGALQELAEGVASAGKVDDVQDVNGESIVEDKIAKLSKAAVGLGNVDNTADKDKVVKEAGKVTHDLRLSGTLDGGGITSVPYDGSKDTQLSMDGDDFVMEGNTSSSTQSVSYSLKKTGVTPGTYQGIKVDNKGRVLEAEDKGYATKQELQEAIAGKARTFTYDNYQAFVTATDALGSTAMGVGDNVYIKTLGVPDLWVSRVNAVSTLYTYTTDQAIVDALDTTYGLTVGYFTFSKLETEKVDLTNYVTKDDLATDLDDYQKKEDEKLETDAKTIVGAINEVKETADNALSKANANATEISNIKDGTTAVGKAAEADHATSADTAKKVTEKIGDRNISDIFDGNTTTVKEAKHAASSDKVANKFLITTPDETNSSEITHNAYDGSEKKVLSFDKDDFYGNAVSDNVYDGSEYTGTNIHLRPTGVVAGQYSAVNVNAKGRVTAGGQSIEWGTKGQTKPSDSLMIGGLFMELQS